MAQSIKKLLDTLNISGIIPVSENSLNHSNEANYRTVRILPLVPQKFEKTMYDKLYEYIENFCKKRKVSKGFFLNIYFFVITSRKLSYSAVLFLKKKAPLRIFAMFFKLLLQLFQSTLMKRSMTEFGSVLGL